MAALAVVAACGSEDDTAPQGGTGAAGGEGGGGSGGSECPAPPSAIEVIGSVAPGATLGLRVDVGDGATVAWSADLGTIDPSGAEVEWVLPADSALHVAELAMATAVVSVAGCPDVTLEGPIRIDRPLADRTVVITNPNAPGSTDVGDHYAAFRGIAEDHLCPVPASDPTVLPGADYEAWIDAVLGCVDALGEHIHYLVPVYGVPYKVSGRIGDLANPANIVTVSLDALAAYGEGSKAMTQTQFNVFYRPGNSMTGEYDPLVPFGELRAANAFDYFLVARIDGADADAAMALVDRTEAAEALAEKGTLAGTVYVDGNRGVPHPTTDGFGSYESGEWNIIGVENVFVADDRYDVVADYNSEEFGTAPAPLTCPDALYYAGWYSFGHYNDAFSWNVGAIGGHLDSCSACDIRGATDWSAQALRKGITATFGAVNEPYVAGMPEYDQFFAYLLAGATYGEAAYESTRVGAWMMVWIGDPLYRPYPPPPKP
jgi:uncharacterized protein (TIGR03790 family)